MFQLEGVERSDSNPLHRSLEHPGKRLFQMLVVRLSLEVESTTETKCTSEVDLKWWYSTLYAHTQRKITYPNNRLPGIAGLAKEFIKRTGYNYICGLWREDIIRGLCWSSLRFRLQTPLESSPPSGSRVPANVLEDSRTISGAVRGVRPKSCCELRCGSG
jgi:hypothetical protein